MGSGGGRSRGELFGASGGVVDVVGGGSDNSAALEGCSGVTGGLWG